MGHTESLTQTFENEVEGACAICQSNFLSLIITIWVNYGLIFAQNFFRESLSDDVVQKLAHVIWCWRRNSALVDKWAALVVNSDRLQSTLRKIA